MSGRRIATVTLVVATYDEALAWYLDKLGFLLLEDISLGDGKRWVVIAPSLADGSRLLLAEASDARQRRAVGAQTGGRVGFFLETDDFDRDHRAMTANGVHFHEAPRREAYGTVAVFEDLYGNLWDLLEPKRQSNF